ncbi:hypothetical protein JCM30471_01190 [Desulfuromonas carbonis]|nr:type IV pilus assembly lipoprotein PilP [Desulfuromonas sp. DDH964]
MPFTNLRRVGLILIACLLSWGCSEEAPAPSSPPQAKKAQPAKAAPVDAAAQVEEAPEVAKYVYNPMGRRDPFVNPLKDLTSPAGQDGDLLTPLQKVDLGQLRVVGIIVGRGEPAAMVVGPGSRSFILKKGVKVGKNDGVVIGIDADTIKVREKYIDFSGEVRTSIQELQLPKRGGVN